MKEIIDQLGIAAFGRSRTEAHAAHICVMCASEATLFRDDLSEKEYNISGMCQKCQDEVFFSEQDI